MNKNIIITMGDPAGIGPEIIAKWLKSYSLHNNELIIILGSYNVFKKYSDINIEKYSNQQNGLYFIDIKSKDEVLMGKPTKESGLLSFKYLDKAISVVERISDKKDTYLVTMPISKEAWKMANISYRGHTGYLKDRAGVDDVLMYFYGEKLKIGLITTHTPLFEVANRLNLEKIYSKAFILNEYYKKYFNISPKIGLLGLNPHSGENGIIGTEEEILNIASSFCQKKGINLSRPLVPDAFWRYEADCYLACYHDQALILFKYIHGFSGINMTLGLPYMRLSVDHGTAFDIVGKGIADTLGMEYIMEYIWGKRVKR